MVNFFEIADGWGPNAMWIREVFEDQWMTAEQLLEAVWDEVEKTTELIEEGAKGWYGEVGF